MKITKQELNEIIKEAVENKLASLNEDVNFTAKRNIVMAAQHAAKGFESEIIKAFDLRHPDRLPTEIQEKYYAVVKEMERDFVAAVQKAVRELVRFPKNKGRDER